MRKYSFVLFRPNRLAEYASYISMALDAGYDAVSFESWAMSPDEVSGPTLVLRHDLDADAASAIALSDIERDLGVVSTFYLRWSTFDPVVVGRLRANGSQVGFHYETLTRYAIERGLNSPDAITPAVLSECRSILQDEVATFQEKAGACLSITAHGDERRHLIGHDNSVLLRGEEPAAFGVELNGDSGALKRRIDCSVSDGEGYPTFWCAGIAFPDALSTRSRLIVFNSHPHHWLRGTRAVRSRALDQVRFVARHPLTWELGKPEALAWYGHKPRSSASS